MVNNKNKQQKKTKQNRAPRRAANFGPVSTINTAPVSYGNSVRGSRPRVSQTTDGARVVGRDFAFSLTATAATVTNFEIIGGMPLTPCVLPSSVLRNYCQMFQKFKINSITVHYITSSPTSQAGDVLFYYERDALAPMIDYSNSSFLPFVLSDPHTVIGPQWMNHSAMVKPTPDWKSTLYGNQNDLNEDKAGSVWLFSKTNSASSPGYILIDYDISFKELSVNPRAGSLPIARGQAHFTCLDPGSALVINTQVVFGLTTGGFRTVANLAPTVPTGYTLGDIYKVILQVTASQLVNPTWSGTTPPTVTNYLRYSDDTAITLDDGFTCYARATSSTQLVLYPTVENAVTNTSPIEAGVSATSVAAALCAEMHFIRSVDGLTQSSY
jgi:hypothetical protein